MDRIWKNSVPIIQEEDYRKDDKREQAELDPCADLSTLAFCLLSSAHRAAYNSPCHDEGLSHCGLWWLIMPSVLRPSKLSMAESVLSPEPRSHHPTCVWPESLHDVKNCGLQVHILLRSTFRPGDFDAASIEG